MIALYPHQADVRDRGLAAIRSGSRRVLYCLPTGSGKTACAQWHVADEIERGGAVLFLAHRVELIRQAFVTLVRGGLHPSQVGIVMGSVPSKCVDDIAGDPASLTDAELWRLWARRRPGAPVQVASTDTLRDCEKPLATMVIIDEAHRAHRDIARLYPGAVVIGLTATPGDVRGSFDALIQGPPCVDLERAGYLSRARVFTAEAHQLPDLSRVETRGDDYDLAQLGAAMDRDPLIQAMIDHREARAPGKRTFAFLASVAHSHRTAEAYRGRGIPALHVDGTTDDRDVALARFRAGEIQVLCSVDVFTEGTDVREAEVVQLARPTKSLRVFLQQCGRGARPFGDGTYLVLDHAGCAVEHGLPGAARVYSLAGLVQRAEAVRVCDCYAVLGASVTRCPECGEALDPIEPVEQRTERVQESKPTRPSASKAWTVKGRDVAIQHIVSKVIQKVTYIGGYGKNFECRWPTAGNCAFDRATGAGLGQVVNWKLTLAALRDLRGDPDYVIPTAEPTTKKSDRKTATKADRRDVNMPLFGGKL